ncbi:uncharacterized protein LOC143024610 isoform X2 [Oratosquilla oratoria]
MADSVVSRMEKEPSSDAAYTIESASNNTLTSKTITKSNGSLKILPSSPTTVMKSEMPHNLTSTVSPSIVKSRVGTPALTRSIISLNMSSPVPKGLLTHQHVTQSNKELCDVHNSQPSTGGGGGGSGKEEEKGEEHGKGRRGSKVISVPVGMGEHGPVEVYREVHMYPAGSIRTVVEKKSYLGDGQVSTKPPVGTSKTKKKRNRHRKKGYDNGLHEGQHYTSQSSLASSATLGSRGTVSSDDSSNISRSSLLPSMTNLSENRNDSNLHVLKSQNMMRAIRQVRDTLDSASNFSDNHSDHSSNALEVMSNYSDTSSNLSTLSDLSGYEDEYLRIKRLVSDSGAQIEDHRRLLNKLKSKPPPKTTPIVDYEKNIKELQVQKEDLEIQLHRLSIQVQNAVREKEVFQQQVEIMQTKITETNQKQYFEVLKQRANLEGQLEMLKQELENSVYEKTQLQTKLNKAVSDTQTVKEESAAAIQAKQTMSEEISDLKSANALLSKKIAALETSLENKAKECGKSNNELREKIKRCDQFEVNLEQVNKSKGTLESDLESMRLKLSEVQQQNQNIMEAKAQAESAIRVAAAEIEAANASKAWYQEHLHEAQTARATLQQEVMTAQSSLTMKSSQFETLQGEVASLKQQLEEGKERAFREKEALLHHLETIQADMVEREAVFNQVERDRGASEQLFTERVRKLEEDRQKLHQLRLTLADRDREIDMYKDDLKQKMILIRKHESELKTLHQSVAVNTEQLNERNVRINLLESKVDGLEISKKGLQNDLKIKDSQITTLKEEKLKLEVSLGAANAEKKEVDDAIAKVREEMSKLTTNFYKMKHDIAAKDREIDTLKADLLQSSEMRKTLEEKVNEAETVAVEKVKVDDMKKELETLNVDIKEMTLKNETLQTSLDSQKKVISTFEIEKKSLTEAVSLREDQIQNMQESLENYREAILKKDEEIYLVHEQYGNLEKSYAELQRACEIFGAESEALKHEIEESHAHEKMMKRELSDLRESIQKERKLKQSLEKKLENTGKEYQEILDKEKATLEVLKQQVLAEKNESELKLKTAEEEKLKSESRNAEMQIQIESLRKDLQNHEKIRNDLNKQLEKYSFEKDESDRKLISVEEQHASEIKALKESQQNLSVQIEKIKAKATESEEQVANVNKDNERLNLQIHSLTKENEYFKKKCETTERKQMERMQQTGNYEQILENEKRILLEKISLIEKNNSDLTSELSKVTNEFQEKEDRHLRERLALEETMKNIQGSKQQSEVLATTLQQKIVELQTLMMEKDCTGVAACKERDELVLQNRDLTEEYEKQKKMFLELECFHAKLKEDHKSKLHELQKLQKEKYELLARYENLRDYIPERDVSVQPAVEIPIANRGVDPVVPHFEEIAASKVQEQKSVNQYFTSSPSDMQFVTSSTNEMQFVDSSKFSQTMLDLQDQVSLTSDALHNKERQIQELQNEIQAFKVENQKLAIELKENSVESKYKQEIQHMTQRIESLMKNGEEKEKDWEHNSKKLLEKIHTLESQVAVQDSNEDLKKKVATLEESLGISQAEVEELKNKATSSATDFQEKQRRYESNVRLLTRKLKEHMKGRKAVERERQTIEEDHQRLIECEKERCETLKKKCLDLECGYETAESSIRTLECQVEELKVALAHAREEAVTHHQTMLELQKENGKLQELGKKFEAMKEEIQRLENALCNTQRECDATTQNLQLVKNELQEEKKKLISSYESLDKEKNLQKQLKEEHQKTNSEMEQLKEKLTNSEHEYKVLLELKGSLEEESKHLQVNLTAAEEKVKELGTEQQNQHQEITSLQLQLQKISTKLEESTARSEVFESKIKVLEVEVKAKEENTNLLEEKYQYRQKVQESRIQQLEQSLAGLKEELATATSKASVAQRERISYQNQVTELRMALHSALQQIKDLKIREEKMAKAVEEDMSKMDNEDASLPSPQPLDMMALTQLMERTARPKQAPYPLTTLHSCLSSLKEEVASLQNQLQSKKQQLESDTTGDEPPEEEISQENATSSTSSITVA